jgi:hypothetical protein
MHMDLGIYLLYQLLHIIIIGRDSVIGIETRYGLEGPGIESQ